MGSSRYSLDGRPISIKKSDEDVDAINAWMYKLHENDLWVDIYAQWTSGFERLIAASQAFPSSPVQRQRRIPLAERLQPGRCGNRLV